MQWNRDQKPLFFAWRDSGGDQPGEQRSKRDSSAVLECQNQLARGIGVECTCRDTVVNWRITQAWRADRTFRWPAIPEWPLA